MGQQSKIAVPGKGAPTVALNNDQLGAYKTTAAVGGGLQSSEINRLASEELARRTSTNPNAQATSPNQTTTAAPVTGDQTVDPTIPTRKPLYTDPTQGGVLGVQTPKTDSTGITRGTVF
jgi:hypothetical protein